MLELDSIKNRFNIQKIEDLLQREHNLVFVDKESVVGELKPKSTLILSPSFYWVKRERLPVKYSFEVKKLLPSIFDTFLPEGEYNYKFIKAEDREYILIAYSDKEIVANLRQLGIKDSMIGDIYFAQTEFSDISKPLQISTNYALIEQNGVICRIPLSFVAAYDDISTLLREKRTSKHRVNINIFTHSIIDTKSIKKLSVLFLIVILSLFAKYFLYQEQLSSFEEKRASISKQYGLPVTQIQLDALKRSLARDNSAEMEIRRKISHVLETPITKNEFFHKFVIDKRSIRFEVALREPKRAEILKEYLQKEITIEKIRVVDNIMSVDAKI